MACMKCGAETPETQVFCDHCLALMEDYPIKPGTHIHLPKRALAVDSPKKPVKKKRTLSPEEQISALKLKVMRLRLAAAILAFLFCVASGFLAMKVFQAPAEPTTGRNYTVDISLND
jgi:hypothetical protein